MNRESCIQTIELLRQLALNIHGVIDVIDDRNCNDIINLLKEQEEIIQCKDCHYYHKPEYGFTIGDCTYRTAWYPVKENEFCSLAKRKEVTVK